MAITEIEMNTSTLGRDIDSLENMLGQLETQIEKMYGSITDLDRMWDGPANEAFNHQFSRDYQLCLKMCQVLKELIDSLQHAKTEYEKCEQNVDILIRTIKV